MKLNRLLVAVLSVAWLFIPGMLTSQQQRLQSPEVLRSHTRLVVVDVVASDGKGQLISDLKEGDLTVVENGRTQNLSGFSFHPSSVSKIAVNSQLPPNVVTNTPAFQASSLNVMLLDTLNGDFAEHAYVKDQLLKYLARAQLTRPIALFAMEDHLVMLHDFTTDAASLRRVVEKFKPPARNNNAETVQSRASVFATHGDFHTNDRDIGNTLNQLNALSKTLAGYPGRKNLIWLSESFPVSLFPDSTARGSSGICNGDSCGGAATNIGRAALEGTGEGSYKDYALLIKKVSDALMSAQVAVYVVDAGAVGKDERIASHVTMNEMADRTGGKAFIGSNDLASSMAASLDDGSAYYTLEYYPDNKTWDGQFRTIQVKSSRPGLNLRYRQGYYAVDPEKLSKDEGDKVAEDFSRALLLDAPAATSVLFQVQVLPPERSRKVAVNFHINPRTMAFEHKADGTEYAKVSCTVWAYGKDKDKPTMSSETVNANLNRDDYQKMMRQQFFPCGRELELKPGTYTLRVGVLDRTANKMGTASAQVTVP